MTANSKHIHAAAIIPVVLVAAAFAILGTTETGMVGWLAKPAKAADAEPKKADPSTQPARPGAKEGHSTKPATAAESSKLPIHGLGLEGRQNFEQFRLGNRNVKALLVDAGVAWIGTSSGLVRFDTRTDQHQTYNNRNGLLSNGIFHLSKVNGELWVGTYGGGLSVLTPGSKKWRNYNLPHGLADAFVYDVLKTRNGDLWIATWSGANRIIGGEIDKSDRWQLFTVENTGGGLPNDWVYGLAEGKNGEIWLATEGGLARFREQQWQNWQHADGLGAPYEQVKSEIEFRNDPAQYSAHHARQKQEQGLGDVKVAYNPNYVVSLAVEDDGTVWAGTWGGGLSRFDGERWQTFTVKDGLPGNHVFSLARDHDGDLWIGTSRGLAKMHGGKFTVYGRRQGLYSDTVFSMTFSPDGEAWIGGYGGLTRFPRGPLAAVGARTGHGGIFRN